MIETRDDFVQVLATLGWLPWKDEVSDQCASIRIGGIVLEMVMGYRDFRQNIHVEAERQVIRISMGGSVTTDAVSTAYTLFFHPRKRYSESCIILQREAPEIKKAHVTFEDVRLMSDDLKNWAASCKI